MSSNRGGRPRIRTSISSTVKEILEEEAAAWDMTLTGYITHKLWEHARCG